MLSDDWTPIQFFVEDTPRMAVCEVSLKHIRNIETGQEHYIFRCTCWEFTPKDGCKHVDVVLLNIAQRGDGRYLTPMLPTTPDKEIEKAANDPAAYRELMLRHSVIRYIHEEDNESDVEG